MVSVPYEDGTFSFEIKRWHKIWALESKIRVTREQIIKAYQNKEELTFWKGFRMPGTEIPSYIAAGTFYKKGRNFWDVMNKNNTIIIELNNHYYKRLIIEVENPEEMLQLLNTSYK